MEPSRSQLFVASNGCHTEQCDKLAPSYFERGARPDALTPVSARRAPAASYRISIKMPDPKDHPKSSEWRPYVFARDQWHCRICGDRFLYSEMVRKHIVNEHKETMPPSMYEYFHGAVWQRKKLT
jgi:hypothetical protein